jgi:hypothetical protein
MNSGVLLFENGLISTLLESAISFTPYFNGGTPTGLLGSLVIDDTAVPVARVAGLGYTNLGSLCVSTGIAPAAWVGGLPVTAEGRLCVDYDGVPVNWVAGIPLDAAGRVCLVTPVPPLSLKAFDSAFDTGFN